MLLLGTKNVTSQTVITDGIVNIGNVYRRYCKKNNCGIPTFSADGNGVTLQQDGVYHVTATFVASGTVAGDLTIQLLENGVATIGALSTETIATADTELRTLVIDYYVLVNSSCLLGQRVSGANTISFANTGVGATITSAVVNVEKVV